MISYLTENLLKIKELAGFSGGHRHCACQQASLINTGFCSSNVPCQQAIITLVDFNKAELILCVSLKFRFSSFHNFLTGKSLKQSVLNVHIQKDEKSLYAELVSSLINNLQWGIKFPGHKHSLLNFFYLFYYFEILWKYLVYEIFLEKIN